MNLERIEKFMWTAYLLMAFFIFSFLLFIEFVAFFNCFSLDTIWENKVGGLLPKGLMITSLIYYFFLRNLKSIWYGEGNHILFFYLWTIGSLITFVLCVIMGFCGFEGAFDAT